MKSIAKKEIEVNLVREYTLTPKVEELGTHKATLELWEYRKGSYSVEWDIPSANEYVNIGVFCYERDNEDVGREKVMSDYDGVFSIPDEVIKFLEENGFDCEYAK